MSSQVDNSLLVDSTQISVTEVTKPTEGQSNGRKYIIAGVTIGGAGLLIAALVVAVVAVILFAPSVLPVGVGLLFSGKVGIEAAAVVGFGAAAFALVAGLGLLITGLVKNRKKTEETAENKPLVAETTSPVADKAADTVEGSTGPSN